MGVTALFLPQEKIDIWESDGTVDFDGESLGLKGEPPSVELLPAVRFIKEVSGGEDPNDLVGAVKTIEEITELGADHYRDSVLIGETAYEVVEGYIASPQRVVTEVAKTSYGNEKDPQKWQKKGQKPSADEPSATEPEPEEPPEPAETASESTPEKDETKPESMPDDAKNSEADELARLLLEKL